MSMLTKVLLGACLLATVTAYEGNEVSALENVDSSLLPALERIFLDDGLKGLTLVLGTQGVMHALVIIAVVVLFRELALGLEQNKGTDYYYYDEPARQDSYTFYEHYDAVYNHPSYQDQNGRQRSLEDESFLSRVLNSIDPVESTFTLLRVEEQACRKRTVCELQRAASKMPLLGSIVQYFSPSIRGLDEYREAQSAGAALEDCSLLFSDCPTSLVQNIWGTE